MGTNTPFSPEFVIIIGSIAGLLFSDYYLTLLGYSLYKKYSSSKLEFEHYELNPLWQQSIQKFKKLNPIHIFFVLTSLFLVSLVWIIDLQPFQFFIGIIVIPYLIVNLQHLGNILNFYHLKKRPQDIQGKQKLSHVYVLKSSLLRLTQFELLLIFLAIIEKSLIIFGGILGLTFLLIRFWFLYWKEYQKEISTSFENTNDETPST
ncbi:MAG: hypothetical protein ACFFCQ_11820 [Promethearchaeota archaeon]